MASTWETFLLGNSQSRATNPAGRFTTPLLWECHGTTRRRAFPRPGPCGPARRTAPPLGAPDPRRGITYLPAGGARWRPRPERSGSGSLVRRVPGTGHPGDAGHGAGRSSGAGGAGGGGGAGGSGGSGSPVQEAAMIASNSARTRSSSRHIRSTNASCVRVVTATPHRSQRFARRPPDQASMDFFCELSTATCTLRGFACSATGMRTTSTPFS